MEVRHIKNIILMIMKELGLADLLSPPFPSPLTFSVYLRLSHNMDQHFVVDSTRFLFTTLSLSLSQYLYGFVLLCASPFFFMTKTQQQEEQLLQKLPSRAHLHNFSPHFAGNLYAKAAGDTCVLIECK